MRELFDSFLSDDPGYSAQLSVYRGGTKVVDLCGGPGFAPGDITGTYSCSKGVAAFVSALLVLRRGVHETPAGSELRQPSGLRHEGANPALGFADPGYGLEFGYVPRRSEEGRTGGRAHRLSTAVRRAAHAAS